MGCQGSGGAPSTGTWAAGGAGGGSVPTGSVLLTPGSLAAGIFCPEGNLYFFSVAGCGGAGSAAAGGCALCEEVVAGSSAVAGKLLAT